MIATHTAPTTAPIVRVMDEVRPGIEWTPEGFGRVWVRVATSGRMAYPEKGFIAWVPTETVVDAEAVRSLIGKPVFVDHPTDEITPDLVARSAVGFVLEAEARDGELYAHLQIDRPAGLDYCRARNWAITVSPGYGYRPDRGINGADIAQMDRRYDHVALTDYPRGGPRVRSILTATDSIHHGATDMLDIPALAERLVSAGLEPDAAAALAEEIAKMIPEPEAAVEVESTDEDGEGSAGKTSEATMDANKRIARLTAENDALRKQIDDMEIATCRDAVVAAAKSAGIGDAGPKADIAKLAERVLAAKGITRRGRDAAVFVRDAAILAPVVGSPARHVSRDRITTPDPTNSTAGKTPGMEY